jgi:hypothetical protein
MLLTSLAGVLLASHAALLLLEPVLGFDAIKWAAANQAALNGAAVALIVLGILLQAMSAPDEDDSKPGAKDEPEQPEPEIMVVRPIEKGKHRPWWRRLFPISKSG